MVWYALHKILEALKTDKGFAFLTMNHLDDIKWYALEEDMSGYSEKYFWVPRVLCFVMVLCMVLFAISRARRICCCVMQSQLAPSKGEDVFSVVFSAQLHVDWDEYLRGVDLLARVV